MRRHETASMVVCVDPVPSDSASQSVFWDSGRAVLQRNAELLRYHERAHRPMLASPVYNLCIHADLFQEKGFTKPHEWMPCVGGQADGAGHAQGAEGGPELHAPLRNRLLPAAEHVPDQPQCAPKQTSAVCAALLTAARQSQLLRVPLQTEHGQATLQWSNMDSGVTSKSSDYGSEQ